ncbi:MAG: ComEC/Rec2 family competence protein, partial [Fimbriimonas sp.]
DWRMGYRSALRRVLPERIATVADALCFNMASALDPELYGNLRRTGTVHIISASGAHVAILAVFLDFVLGALLPLGRKWRLLVLFGILVLYAIATGLNPPIIRSVFMAMVLLWAYVLRREPDGLCALGCAALIALAVSPAGLFEPSFQLSFAAMLGLITLINNRSDDSVDALQRFKRKAVAAGQASIVAIYATTPIIAYWFGTFATIAVLANLMIVPVLPPLIIFPMLAQGLATFRPELSAWVLSNLYAPLCGWLMYVVDSLGSLSWASTDLPAIPIWFWIPYYCVGLIWWRKRLETT